MFVESSSSNSAEEEFDDELSVHSALKELLNDVSISFAAHDEPLTASSSPTVVSTVHDPFNELSSEPFAAAAASC